MTSARALSLGIARAGGRIGHMAGVQHQRVKSKVDFRT
jgi:hypothetical protein